MVLTLIYYLLVTALILFPTIIFVSLFIAICFKLKLEPIKGVCKSSVRLEGKIALVTGGNQGIGLETARDLASRGAKVIIACRDAKKSAEAIADIIATTGNEKIEYKYLDLATFRSIRKFAEDFNKSYDRLHILVNNAGCGGLIPKPSEDGIDVVLQVNYFGPFLLVRLLLDKLITSKPSRIVIVSSWLHNFAKLNVEDLNQTSVGTVGLIRNYANSKLFNILWMQALAKRLPKGVTVNSLHPGVVKTEIFKTLHPLFKKIFDIILDLLFKSPKEGAQTTLHLCVAEELENVSGKYFMECKEAEYSRLADDDELVERVYKETLNMIRRKVDINDFVYN